MNIEPTLRSRLLDRLYGIKRDERGEAREPFGPVTLYQMSSLYREYDRAMKLADYNRSGRNPRFPGDAGRKVGDALAAKAERLAASFPRFKEGR